MYSYGGKAEFLAVIAPVFSITSSFRNNFNILIETFIIIIKVENSCAALYFCKTVMLFFFFKSQGFWLIESPKE